MSANVLYHTLEREIEWTSDDQPDLKREAVNLFDRLPYNLLDHVVYGSKVHILLTVYTSDDG